MTFAESLKLNDLGPMLEDQFGRWGHFTEDAARAIILTCEREPTSKELVAVTWLNESVFRFFPEPNMNGHPDEFLKWDVGPMQTNVFWVAADIKVKFYAPISDADAAEMFGTATPFFSGNPMANLRIAARKLQRLSKTSDEERAVKYTGPKARPYRLESWQKYGWRFHAFFQAYTATSDNKVSATSTALQPSESATSTTSGRTAPGGPPNSKGVV